MSWWDKLWAGQLNGRDTLDNSMNAEFTAERIAEMSAYVSELMTAIQNGEEVSEEDMENLKTIVTFLNGLQLTDTGANIRAGIAEGLVDAGWDTDAETVASDLETALNAALQIQSPSRRMVPIGDYAAQGLAEGLTGYSFDGDATAVADKIERALSASLPAYTFRRIGINAMHGLRDGIYAGTAGVIPAIRVAAKKQCSRQRTS